MTQQTRRQFFKTLATTVAGVVAVGVAPRVVAKKLVPFKPNLMQETIISKSRQQGMSGGHLAFKVFATEADRLKYLAKCGL